jgi:hypothetical protein
MSFVENWGTILNGSPRVFDVTNLKDSVGEMGKSHYVNFLCQFVN